MLEQFPGHRFAGITEPERLGLGVEENANVLHRFAFLERNLLNIAAARLLSTPEWEIKFMLGRHLYEDAEHHNSLRTRITELRRSDRSVDKCPDPTLQILIDEAIRSEDTLELLVAIYRVLKPALRDAYQRHLKLINPLVDYPTSRALRFILPEEEEHIELGNRFLGDWLNGEENVKKASEWENHLRACLSAAGGVAGEIPQDDRPPLPQLRSDGSPWQIPLESGRDARFKVSIPKTPTTETLPHGDSTREGLEQMMWVRFHEMSPAETVGAILYMEKGHPWRFYLDLARHCWDEVRHAAFGQAALQAEGIDITRNPNWTGFAEMALHSMNPMDAYAHLTVAIEQAAMKYPPGKRQEYEFCRDTAKHPLMALYQDYDWADEVNHSQFGQEWIIKHEFDGDRSKAIAKGQETIQRRAEFFSQYIDQGIPPDPITSKGFPKGSAAGY